MSRVDRNHGKKNRKGLRIFLGVILALILIVGGGAVTIVFSGAMELMSIKIDPEVVDGDDVEMLEDLVLAAVNEGIKEVQDLTNSELGSVTGGMNLPGM